MGEFIDSIKHTTSEFFRTLMWTLAMLVLIVALGLGLYLYTGYTLDCGYYDHTSRAMVYDYCTMFRVQ